MSSLDPATRDLLDRGAAELWRDGALVGHLTTALEQGWGPGRPLGTQTFAWFLVTLESGDPYIIEDYPPYATIPEAVAGSLRAEWPDQPPYEVRWLAGSERARVWEQHGVHRSPVSYRSEGSVTTDRGWSRLLRRTRRRGTT